ncbi:IQ calmodulin-binding motif family protein [Trichomonas vaginalis G3]|uniref:IQ calmodulin-binding motif family protein n=1 Tax=Trichomonas vaginalis (strain ATCC PRA-98 / G3) TaxID=412133 RepID=A2EG16_TRIV3|nr:LP06937P family [Trichomonas vaginalis G3]EAY08377.1 IQ calmodulin-binding motif family protein [Trichomonas vaginalis G3]KAI5499343.1 LP06937P family [Trichomonas vaginalis G3]|eukprot:XP_001320600.1 IQ calmodulin-binding motif family protein [Trichomonas vaginalis G3]
MGEGDLVPILVYECNDIPVDSIPLENIKYLGVSVMNLTNLSLVTKLKSLTIVMFRLCALSQFPEELFELPQLRSIDLSGNAISQLPQSPKWSEMKELTSFNISENNINELSEFRNIMGIPNLKQLNFTGNVCQGANDALNRIVKIFPKIIVVNETIVLSQHRGYLEEFAIFDNTSTLPLSKTDDFFFNYVKYMHATGMERYLRRFNAENFCLNKVLRKYSFAEKIQSNFRGYVQRKEYKKMRESAVVIQYHVHKWYKRRLASANVIKRCFLHYMTRQKIKLIKAARIVQSRWRSKQVADLAVMELFSSNDRIEFYVTPDNAKFLENFCREKQFAIPQFIYTNEYRVLRVNEPTKLILPGSPLVYYSLDNSLVIRHVNQKRSINPKKTCWCNHEHDFEKGKKMVNQRGFNYQSKCPFGVLPAKLYRRKIRSVDVTDHHPCLVMCFFERLNDFMQIFHSLRLSDIKGVQLIPIRNVPAISATVTIQSAMRCFYERSKHFRELKQTAIEHRALATIRCLVSIMRMKRILEGIARAQYFREKITKLSYFYVRDTFMRKLFFMKPIIPVHFGYNNDRELVLKEGNSPLVSGFLPVDTSDFKESDLSSVLKLGASVSMARATYFADPWLVTDTFLKRYGFHRISFATAEEAAHRAILLSFVVPYNNWCFFEKDIIDFLAATMIKNAWIGHTSRSILAHAAAQVGKKLDTSIFIYRPVDYRLKMQLMKDDQQNRKKKVVGTENVEDQIDLLRGVYQPWKEIFTQYKKEYGDQPIELTPLPKRPKKELTTSMRQIGQINELLPPEPEPEQPQELTQTKVSIQNTTPRSNLMTPKLSKTNSRSVISPLFETRPRTSSIKTSNIKKIVGFDSSQSMTTNVFGGSLVDSLICSRSTTTKISQMTNSLELRKSSISNQTSQIIARPLLKLPLNQIPQSNTNTSSINSSSSKIKSTSTSSSLGPLKTIQSAQRSDYSQKEKVAEVFGRLSQLLKVTDAVHQANVLDTTLEEKRQFTVHARQKIEEGSAATHKMLEQNSSDSHSRAKIEREEMLAEVEKVKKKAMEQKINAARNVRKEHSMRRENVMIGTIFAQNFVSTTHQLASRVEGRILKQNKRKERELVQTQMAEVREKEKQSRLEHKELVKEMAKSKLEMTKYDNELFEEEKKLRMKGTEEKKERLATLKSTMKQNTLTRSLDQKKPYIPPDKIETAVFDDKELMASEAPKIIGGNIGTEESHLLAELVSSAMK